ncbi:MAG: serine protease [Luteolibacter sp.]|nr:serine protease [Luteolibacter sp.]
MRTSSFLAAMGAAAWLHGPVLSAEPETGAEATAPVTGSKELINKHFDSVAIITGDGGSGTGFITKDGGRAFLYTAAHVISGNKRLTVKNANGREFRKFGAFEVASESDLARLELLEEFEGGLQVAKPASIKVNDPVLAIGNSGGAGALAILEGSAMSLGPDVVEVSSNVIQGNSGGPLFSGNTGEVVGVVTHLIAARDDLWAKDTKFAEVRRFATRLDRVITWERVPIGRFLAEHQKIEEFNRNSRILFAISSLNPTQDGLRLDSKIGGNGPTLLSVFDENKNVPIVAELIEMNSKLGDKRLRTSEAELRKRFASYYQTSLTRLDQGGDKFVAKDFSGQNRERAKQAREWRDEAVTELKNAANRMR